MKRIALITILMFLAFGLFAEELVYIKTNNEKDLKTCLIDNGLTINYWGENFIIATAFSTPILSYETISNDVWIRDSEYFVTWFTEEVKTEYFSNLSDICDVLLLKDEFAILEVPGENVKNIFPAIHNGLVRITQKEAKLPEKKFNYTRGTLDEDPFITELVSYVNQDTLQGYIQHLEDYGTRDWYTPESIEAQNWIKATFEGYGLEAEIFEFSLNAGGNSNNVIAKLPGTVYPDQYVVLGAHYDSRCWSGDAPGADDNASGTSGILEIARILSQYEFKRTIIFCTWSGEEYGLIGSNAWASWAQSQGMNILGYYNIDMSGYLQEGSYIHTDVIAPASALDLVEYYTDVTAIYLPDFLVEAGALSGGDSDHTSFNNNGYMGIFPFEDSQNYSPYIHTTDDMIGPSVNNMVQVKTFTQAVLASVVSMSDMLTGPTNLMGIPEDGLVTLLWDELVEAASYNIYKDAELLTNQTQTEYIDTDVENGIAYSYYVTAIYQESGEESVPSNEVTVIPLPPIDFPFLDEYETGALDWSMEGSWGLTELAYISPSHSMTESPVGNYTNNLDIKSTLRSFSLEGAFGATMSFVTKYALESGYDYMYLEISTNGNNWTELDQFNGFMYEWIEKSYSLDDYLGEPFVLIRFRMYSDSYETEDGMYIDDFRIDLVGVGTEELINSKSFSIYPNPFSEQTIIHIDLETAAELNIDIYDMGGRKVKTLAKSEYLAGQYKFIWAGKDQDNQKTEPGAYLVQVTIGNITESTKIILTN